MTSIEIYAGLLLPEARCPLRAGPRTRRGRLHAGYSYHYAYCAGQLAHGTPDWHPLSFLLPAHTPVSRTSTRPLSPPSASNWWPMAFHPVARLSYCNSSPMTIVMIDEVELALETRVARHVWVKRRRAVRVLFERKGLE